jgi:hypothetical protein
VLESLACGKADTDQRHLGGRDLPDADGAGFLAENDGIGSGAAAGRRPIAGAGPLEIVALKRPFAACGKLPHARFTRTTRMRERRPLIQKDSSHGALH